MINENFKAIRGYEGLYEVSNFGNVRSLKFGRTKILKPGAQKTGYLRVQLCKNNEKKQFYVHRLVAMAFLENPEKKPCIDRINTNPKDNRIVFKFIWI